MSRQPDAQGGDTLQIRNSVRAQLPQIFVRIISLLLVVFGSDDPTGHFAITHCGTYRRHAFQEHQRGGRYHRWLHNIVASCKSHRGA
jgi:hypothetical protein